MVITFRKKLQASLGGFAVDDDVVSTIECAEHVDEVVPQVVDGEKSRVEGQSAEPIDRLETVADLVLGQARVGGDGADAGFLAAAGLLRQLLAGEVNRVAQARTRLGTWTSHMWSRKCRRSSPLIVGMA